MKATTSSRWLLQFLRHRGFRIARRQDDFERNLVVQMAWNSASSVQFKYKELEQSFSLPSQMRDPWLRARTVCNYLDFFLERVLSETKGPLQKRWIKAKEKLRASMPARRSIAQTRARPALSPMKTAMPAPRPVVRARIRPARSPKPRRKTPVVRRHVADEYHKAPIIQKVPVVHKVVAVRKAPVPRKVAMVRKVPVVRKGSVARKAPVVRKKTTVRKASVARENPTVRKASVAHKKTTMRKTPVVRKSVDPPRLAVRKKRRVALANPIRKRSIRRRVLPKDAALQLFIDVGVGLGGPTTPGLLLAGELGLGLSFSRWFRIALYGAVDGYLGGDEEIQILMIQPSLVVGSPYLIFFENKFRVGLDAGITVDLIRSVSDHKEEWRFRAGLEARALFLWTFSERASLYARLSFFLSPQSYQIAQGDEQDHVVNIPFWRISFQVGVRFYTL